MGIMTAPVPAEIDYAVVEWLTDAEQLAYSDYWNDESRERGKPFWILDEGVGRWSSTCSGRGSCSSWRTPRAQRGSGSIAPSGESGVTWRRGSLGSVAPAASGRGENLLRRVFPAPTAQAGPAVLRHCGVTQEQVVLVVGRFHSIGVPDGFFDLVFMSAAFHHSDEPDRLLREIRRVLHPEGVVVLIGEHAVDLRRRHYLTQTLKFIVSRVLPARLQRRLFGRSWHTRRLLPDQQERLVTDAELGDHFYTRSQYSAMFARAGFRSADVRRSGSDFQAFVLVLDPKILTK